MAGGGVFHSQSLSSLRSPFSWRALRKSLSEIFSCGACDPRHISVWISGIRAFTRISTGYFWWARKKSAFFQRFLRLFSCVLLSAWL